MVLLIDNYDSFTWNLAHRLGELGASVRVVRNDVMTVDEDAEILHGPLRETPGVGRQLEDVQGVQHLEVGMKTAEMEERFVHARRVVNVEELQITGADIVIAEHSDDVRGEEGRQVQ